MVAWACGVYSALQVERDFARERHRQLLSEVEDAEHNAQIQTDKAKSVKHDLDELIKRVLEGLLPAPQSQSNATLPMHCSGQVNSDNGTEVVLDVF